MQYPATFTKLDDGSFGVTFRDIPEAITQGNSYEEAVEMAEDALVTAMEFYFEDNRLVPMASQAKDDEVMVNLPLSVWAKVLLLNALLESHVSQTELARRMGVKKQQVTRIVNLEHTTKIDTLAKAFNVLGKKLDLLLV